MKESFHEEHVDEQGRVAGKDPERGFVPIDEVADTDNSWETFGEEVPGELSSEEEEALHSAIEKAEQLSQKEKEVEEAREAAMARTEASLKEEQAELERARKEYPGEKSRDLEPQDGGMFKKLLRRIRGN